MSTHHKIEHLTRSPDQTPTDLENRVVVVCDLYANSGWEIVSVSFTYRDEAWIVLRYEVRP